MGLLVVAWLLAEMLGTPFEPGGWLSSAGNIWRDVAPPFEHAGVLTLTALLAMAVSFVLNRIHTATAAANRWALQNETARGKLLREALEEGELVEVCLATGHCVIGFVEHETRDFEGDISLSPQLSGYRHPRTQALVVTEEYESAADDFRVVLLVDEASSVRHFDPESPCVKWEIPGLTA